MIDWRKSMEQTYEFYEVDPRTWKDTKPLDDITLCNIDRDSSSATLGSATIDCTEPKDECYVRVYLVATQNGYTHREALGTFLIQTPAEGFDGKKTNISLDAYTPLIELKSNNPPIGYSLLEGESIMDKASILCRENMRAPVVPTSTDDKLRSDLVANLNDNWLSFIIYLIANAKYTISLDELGRVLFAPVQDIAALRPVWTYDDGNSSILFPDIIDERDLFNIPNVVEVVYSTGTSYLRSRVVNSDTNSPVSTVNRGREVLYRDTNPSIIGNPTQEMIDEYAIQLLKDLSRLKHTITYKHGYCPVRIDDCVLLDYKRAGLNNVKAKVISQHISCKTGCEVEETAVYTTNLWR